MKESLGKIFFAIAVIGAMMISACIYFYSDKKILVWLGIPIFIIGVIGTCATSKTLRKYLIDLLDFF